VKRPTKIAIGLNAWLTFEQMCKREPLFSEAYLAYPIGQLLATRYGNALVSEHPHPVLAPRKTGRGDKPKLDFAVLRADGSIELAIETKWLSSSPSLQRDIIRDMVRLELACHSQNCDGWLIVAGKSSDFQQLVGAAKFQGHPSHVGSDTILPHGNSRDGRLRLNPPAKFRRDMLDTALTPFAGLDLADCIHVTRFGPYPVDAPANGYVTYLWRINGRRRHQARFKPEAVYILSSA
jgi:hypothetical protein